MISAVVVARGDYPGAIWPSDPKKPPIRAIGEIRGGFGA